MFIESRNGIVRLDPDAARDYARAVMPRLRNPALQVAADLASQSRRLSIPYRLVEEGVASKMAGTKVGTGRSCASSQQLRPKLGRKFCRRRRYLWHVVEAVRPMEKAHTKLPERRATGLRPRRGEEALHRRSAALKRTSRRSLNLSEEQKRDRRAEHAEIRGRRKSQADTSPDTSSDVP